MKSPDNAESKNTWESVSRTAREQAEFCVSQGYYKFHNALLATAGAWCELLTHDELDADYFCRNLAKFFECFKQAALLHSGKPIEGSHPIKIGHRTGRDVGTAAMAALDDFRRLLIAGPMAETGLVHGTVLDADFVRRFRQALIRNGEETGISVKPVDGIEFAESLETYLIPLIEPPTLRDGIDRAYQAAGEVAATMLQISLYRDRQFTPTYAASDDEATDKAREVIAFEESLRSRGEASGELTKLRETLRTQTQKLIPTFEPIAGLLKFSRAELKEFSLLGDSGWDVRMPLTTMGQRMIRWVGRFQNRLNGQDACDTDTDEDQRCPSPTDDCPYNESLHAQVQKRIHAERSRLMRDCIPYMDFVEDSRSLATHQEAVFRETGPTRINQEKIAATSEEESTTVPDARKTDDDLPKRKRKDSPSRVKARAAYDYAMERIPNANAMTIAELHSAILDDGEASAMVPGRSDTFGKYLRDCGVKIYKGGSKEHGGSVVQRSDL